MLSKEDEEILNNVKMAGGNYPSTELDKEEIVAFIKYTNEKNKNR